MNGKPGVGVSFNARHAAEDKAKWTDAIGKFMVAFNGIEQVVDMCIACFGSKNLYVAVHDLNLHRRVQIAKALAVDKKPSPELAKRCKDAFSAIQALEDERNIIAHTAPVTSIYLDENRNFQLRVEVRNKRPSSKKSKDEKPLMTIERLGTLTEDSAKLAIQILGLLCEVTGSSPELPREASAVFDGSAFDSKE